MCQTRLRIWIALFLGLVFTANSVSVAQLSAQQDQVTEVTGGPEIRIYRLRNFDVKIAQEVIGSMAESDPSVKIRMTANPADNSLILMAESGIHDRVQVLLESLDKSTAETGKPKSDPAHLVVQVILDFADEGSRIPLAPAADARIKGVLQEAAASGLIREFSDPYVVAESIVRVNPRGKGGSSGRVASVSSSQASAVSMSIEGSLEEAERDEFTLDSQVQIRLQNPTGESKDENGKISTAKIQSESSMNKNHPVLLSVNTIEGRSFLILVEVR